MSSIYSTYNIRYLRISEKQVLPLIIYLRQENLSWFNDIIFQEILSALQRIIPKKFLGKKKNASDKSLSDIYRGSNFQFAYYFRPTDVKHSILIKDNPIIFSPSNPNVSSSQSQTEHAEIKNSSRGNHTSLTNVEDGVKQSNITYQGFNIFRKTLVIIVEPLDKIIEFGDNIQIATAMTIDNYFGKGDAENE
ncbi:hypothetical protein RhiirA5_486077 [Rhizophagus irregularis]|uniref:Uncharacterized protein n=2 Tax=Rhizophagus irregularis TaxID=588596 RepID=A0A2I1ESJ9_9GLOM|nr:hypothetical protein GLOIN_2v1487217 [Rhizophagus irregularis DAOM 181602=DAOM 197198]PKC05234.1 hypothetical protein RhiirA5_486077 [Rhizophagus irregularis]PKC69251.1 hypothetical protein RhiirA1_440115 [Rhizophagus irregularis]PKY25112.1 hypothetical protein RhiirB3_472329 [Rhizophagus irregularis]POG60206.1 hypothetical protein GLOIN_2v1487217 [Rhizophagus irregularis DAOM 181602=DAOM 197198]UZO28350.1 hypothetical protein OCT59_021878 [Rhizophagus irregularis]|eukprot:XP_025167072.1 hypothetical protein GLOIN_2v1487217 [Rhizophagus irregularis DAOM 181602=DAOM 197198]